MFAYYHGQLVKVEENARTLIIEVKDGFSCAVKKPETAKIIQFKPRDKK